MELNYYLESLLAMGTRPAQVAFGWQYSVDSVMDIDERCYYLCTWVPRGTPYRWHLKYRSAQCPGRHAHRTDQGTFLPAPQSRGRRGNQRMHVPLVGSPRERAHPGVEAGGRGNRPAMPASRPVRAAAVNQEAK